MVLYDLPASYDGGFGWKPTTIFGVSTNNIFYCQYWQNAAVAREACLWLLKVGQKRRCEFERIFCFKYISKTWSACASWSYKCGCLKCVACHHKTCRDAEETVFVLWRCRDSHWVSLFFSKLLPEALYASILNSMHREGKGLSFHQRPPLDRTLVSRKTAKKTAHFPKTFLKASTLPR